MNLLQRTPLRVFRGRPQMRPVNTGVGFWVAVPLHLRESCIRASDLSLHDRATWIRLPRGVSVSSK